MSIFYGKYLSMLVLMMNLPSILFQLGGNSELTLLDDVKLTFKIHSRHKRSYKLSHKIADQNQKSKIKVIGKRNYLQNIQGINGYLGWYITIGYVNQQNITMFSINSNLNIIWWRKITWVLSMGKIKLGCVCWWSYLLYYCSW